MTEFWGIETSEKFSTKSRTTLRAHKVKDTAYPTLEEALYLHEILLDEFGGRKRVLD
jgi:hypothetical protein